MKRNYAGPLIAVITGIARAVCLVALVSPSGCVSSDQPSCSSIVVGVNDYTVDLTANNITLIVKKVYPGSDDPLPCEKTLYAATAQGWGFQGQLSGAKWVASGDVQISDPHGNPVEIIETKDNAMGTLSLVTEGRESCYGGNKTLAQVVTINASFAKNVGVSSNVCINSVTKTGAGTLQLADAYWLNYNGTSVPLLEIDKCVWTVTAGSATLTPDPRQPSKCLVSNATGDFTVSVQPSIGSCTSDKPLSFVIKMPTCSTL